jgi:hypothetical protein
MSRVVQKQEPLVAVMSQVFRQALDASVPFVTRGGSPPSRSYCAGRTPLRQVVQPWIASQRPRLLRQLADDRLQPFGVEHLPRLRE